MLKVLKGGDLGSEVAEGEVIITKQRLSVSEVFTIPLIESTKSLKARRQNTRTLQTRPDIRPPIEGRGLSRNRNRESC